MLGGAEAGAALQYQVSEGYLPLRRWLAGQMGKLGVACDEANIVITSGSQQALDYLGKLFLSPGDTALVTWPTPVASEFRDCGTNWQSLANVDKGQGIQRAMATRGDAETEATTHAALNPAWVEWLMAMPIGWTDLQPIDPAKWHAWTDATRAGDWFAVDPADTGDVPRVLAKVPHRNARLKAIGNAQVSLAVVMAWHIIGGKP